MSLPSPNLDDRPFQRIVDDVKRQIALRCPEWTEHNVSDPGVTLLELFAYMTEITLYRLNQVPDKNHVKFLDLLGISLETPEPAQTDLRFRITRVIRDEAGAEALEMTLPARQTVVGTPRTETEDSVEFSTDHDLKLVRPRLAHVVAVSDGGDLDGFVGANQFDIEQDRKRREDSKARRDDKPPKPFSVYSHHPTPGDALYIGFENDVSMNLVALQFDCVSAAADGLVEDYPSQVWEYWDGLSNGWMRLDIVNDFTKGFNGARKGGEIEELADVEVAMPQAMHERTLGGHRAYWIRCRYTIDPDELPPRGLARLTPGELHSPPQFRSVTARTIGGTVTASNCTSVYREVLGISDGTPGQVFKLRFSPVLRLREDETIVIGPKSDNPEDMDSWVPWTCVPDFAQSGPEDRHYTLDTLTGEIGFGPVLAQPDGSARQYGATPENGMTVAMSRYRYGGGTLGNVREGKVYVMKRAIPFIESVENPRPATGGRDRESLERAKLRAREILQVRNRAVTADDFEFLAAKATSGVGRAKCIQPVHHPAPFSSEVRAGVVRVLLIPQLHPDTLLPRPRDLAIPDRTSREVFAYLDERRLLTTVLEVDEPVYKYVSVHIRFVADPRQNENVVKAKVEEALNRFIHPLFGGPNGDGWPFRRTLTLTDIYAVVGAVKGVAFLLDAKILVSSVVSKEEDKLSDEEAVPNSEGVRLGEDEVLVSNAHVITAVPISLVGVDESSLGDEGA